MEQVTTEIKVTAVMVDAGLEAYGDLTYHENDPERIVTEVFLAMMKARELEDSVEW